MCNKKTKTFYMSKNKIFCLFDPKKSFKPDSPLLFLIVHQNTDGPVDRCTCVSL